eukprot:m.12308 g.12308  ORF g.12308 m.12308 type:complete len:190 (+) comp4632_c0_seq1:90-659(+)
MTSQTEQALRDHLSQHFTQCYKAFQALDVHNSNHIEVDELRRILAIYNLPVNQAESLFSRIDTKKDGVIDYQEFSDLYFGRKRPDVPEDVLKKDSLVEAEYEAVRKRESEAAETMEEEKFRDHVTRKFSSARKAFLKLDQDRNGMVSKQEINQILEEFNLPLGHVMDNIDLNHDGKVSYIEVAKTLFDI